MLIDLAIPLQPDLPRLRDRVMVIGHEGIYIVIACNSARREVDLAGASQPGYLFAVPVSSIRQVPEIPTGAIKGTARALRCA